MASEPVEYALKYSDDDLAATLRRRVKVIRVLGDLAKACCKDNDMLMVMM